MDVKEFYLLTANRHNLSGSDLLPKKTAFVGKWGQKSRIQIAYELLLPYSPLDCFLDLGCSDLGNLLTLENLFKQGFGIDLISYPSWQLLEDRFTTYEHNLDSGVLPFAESTFDAVTLLMVLEHVFDPFTVIEEISRVTKPQGLLVINVPNIAFIRHRLDLFVGKLPVTSNLHCWEMREWDGGHIHYFTLKKLEWLLHQFGNYEILQVQSSGRFSPIKQLFPDLLGADLEILCRKRG